MLIIVLMGWLYVVLMLAITRETVIGGLALAFFLGVLPTWFIALRVRHNLRRRRERLQEEADSSPPSKPLK